MSRPEAGEVKIVDKINLRGSSEEVFRKMDILFGGFDPTNPSGECPFEGELGGHLRRYLSKNRNQEIFGFGVGHIDDSLLITVPVLERMRPGIIGTIQDVLEPTCGIGETFLRKGGILCVIGSISADRVYSVEPIVWNILSHSIREG